MEHAARHHLRQKLDEDPVHYQKLSERLDAIIAKLGEDWEQLVLALKPFVEEVVGGRKGDAGLGLDPRIEAPFFDLLKEEREKEAPVAGADLKWLADRTRELLENIRQTVSVVGFWKNTVKQEELHGQLFIFLTDHEIVDFDRAGAVADRLVELAKANDRKLRKA